MTTWAKPADVRARWIGSAPLPSDEVIQQWIGDAETLIFAEVSDLEARLTDDASEKWRKRVIYVAVQLTIQALKNPDGVRQQTQGAGTFTNSVTFGTETISQAMTLTAAHRALLQADSARHVGIDMTEDSASAHLLTGAWINGLNGFEPGAQL